MKARAKAIVTDGIPSEGRRSRGEGAGNSAGDASKGEVQEARGAEGPGEGAALTTLG